MNDKATKKARRLSKTCCTVCGQRVELLRLRLYLAIGKAPTCIRCACPTGSSVPMVAGEARENYVCRV